jgi:hypothetical protein
MLTSAHHFALFRNEEQITPERDRQSQRECDRLNRLQMTSPGRRNHRHAAHENQNRPLPPVPQPNFMPAGPAPQWQPPPNFPYNPLPVEQYPNLPQNAIAHVQHAHHPQIDYNARLNEQMNAAHNERHRQCNVHRQQDRDEIRQQAHDELRAADIHPHQQPHIIPDPILPDPPAPLMVEQIRGDLFRRQAQEEFHRQQILQQLQQQEAEWINREAQYALEVQQQEAEQIDRCAQEALCMQQQEAERIDRQNRDILRAHQQEEEVQHCRDQRICEEGERLEEALCEYDIPASQEHHDDDEERRRNRPDADRQEHEEEDQQHVNQLVPIPDGGCPYREPINLHYLGRLDVECPNCHVVHFISEKLTNSSIRNLRFGMCCLQGQVNLPPFPQWPPELQQAYMNQTFVSKICQYNSALAFTSMGVNIEDCTLQGSGPNAFRIHGSLHHLMGSLIPPEGVQPSYTQLYIYDSEEATNIRATRPGNEGLDCHILRDLHDMLYQNHPYAPLYKQAYQVMQEKAPEEQTDVRAHIHFRQGTDGRRYNVPTADEIAVIIPGDGSEEVSDKRDIVLRLQGGQLQHIS